MLKQSDENSQVVTYEETRRRKKSLFKENYKKILTAEEELTLYEKNSKKNNSTFEMKHVLQDYDKRSATVPYTKFDYNRMKNENPEFFLSKSADLKNVIIPEQN